MPSLCPCFQKSPALLIPTARPSTPQPLATPRRGKPPAVPVLLSLLVLRRSQVRVFVFHLPSCEAGSNSCLSPFVLPFRFGCQCAGQAARPPLFLLLFHAKLPSCERNEHPCASRAPLHRALRHRLCNRRTVLFQGFARFRAHLLHGEVALPSPRHRRARLLRHALPLSCCQHPSANPVPSVHGLACCSVEKGKGQSHCGIAPPFPELVHRLPRMPRRFSLLRKPLVTAPRNLASTRRSPESPRISPRACPPLLQPPPSLRRGPAQRSTRHALLRRYSPSLLTPACPLK